MLRIVAVISLGACFALPVMADDENPRAVPRAFELRIAQRSVPQAQRVLRATEGELARLFVPALLPIAFAYHVAHYEFPIASHPRLDD